MLKAQCLTYIGVLIVAVVANQILDDCLTKRNYTMNVVLIEDDTYEWSLKLVEAAVLRAIEVDKGRNYAAGNSFPMI